MKIIHCKLKKSTQKKLLEFFVLEVTARSAADILGIQPNSAILFYRKIREVIRYHLAQKSDEIFDGAVELDEGHFGGYHKEKRDRGTSGIVALFGILKRQSKVDTAIVEHTLLTTYTDAYRSHDVLDVSEFNHEQINHSALLTVKQNHINGIENFWRQAKRILRKYNGIERKNFPLFLKECEFRFNFGTPKEQLKTLRKWCGI